MELLDTTSSTFKTFAADVEIEVRMISYRFVKIILYLNIGSQLKKMKKKKFFPYMSLL